MGSTPAPQPAETLVQLVLRAYHNDALIQVDEDWRVLGLIATRVLFWCGGAVYACRAQGNEMRFALQVVHASLGTIAHQIAGAYATHLRKTRKIGGVIFRHYSAIPLRDDIFLDDLVLWLHRSDQSAGTSSASVSTSVTAKLWTADSAYLVPNSLPWINTDRVLTALSVGAPGPATYRRRKSEQIASQVVEFFTHRPKRTPRSQTLADPVITRAGDHATRAGRPSMETIARFVAHDCKVSYEDMLSATRKRSMSKARAIATVLATRNGTPAAAAARLFNRSRSTLIEQVEHYRARQPEIFADAESRLEDFLAEARE